MTGVAMNDPTPTASKCTLPPSGGSRGPNVTSRIVKWTTAGGILASLGVCAAGCLLPFALLSVGGAGIWVSRLDSLAPYKWVFVALTVTFLGHGFYTVYWKPSRRHAADAACADCGPPRSVRIGLWVATILTIGGMVFEHFEPLLKAPH